ncbi:MAG: hypothetical protein ACFBSC_10480 [Microcoleaceae cyanobacterium]
MVLETIDNLVVEEQKVVAEANDRIERLNKITELLKHIQKTAIGKEDNTTS